MGFDSGVGEDDVDKGFVDEKPKWLKFAASALGKVTEAVSRTAASAQELLADKDLRRCVHVRKPNSPGLTLLLTKMAPTGKRSHI